jgi:YidC/Oxa1 family membrane protein insertase
MANLRPVLLITLALLGYMLWIEWQKDYGQAPAGTPVAQTPVTDDFPAMPPTPSAEDLPPPDAAPPSPAAPEERPQPAFAAENPTVTVRTDVLELEIDPVGGTVVSATLSALPGRPDPKPQTRCVCWCRRARNVHCPVRACYRSSPRPTTRRRSSPSGGDMNWLRGPTGSAFR